MSRTPGYIGSTTISSNSYGSIGISSRVMSGPSGKASVAGISNININNNSSNVNINNNSGKNTYNILGEEYETYPSIELANIISTMNVLGEPYYNELRKQGIEFDKDLDTFIKQRFRDLKISSVINK